ncbi:MAG: (2Fe-2S)-binding protein [Hyphomicrobiaceae bacterium]
MGGHRDGGAAGGPDGGSTSPADADPADEKGLGPGGRRGAAGRSGEGGRAAAAGDDDSGAETGPAHAVEGAVDVETAPADPPLTLAAQALGARIALGRSFRLHRLRGGFCHAGWCQQCRIATPEGPRLACRMPAEAALPKGRRRRLHAGGLAGEALPPWFHETVLPDAVRQSFLEMLRRASGAPAAPTAIPAAPMLEGVDEAIAVHTLVAGGGLSGLAAAREIASAGRSVLLAEAELPGGRARFDPERCGTVAPALAAARSAGVQISTDTLVAGLYDTPRRALLTGRAGTRIVRFEELVVATGAYDRLPAFPGNDAPGVIGGGALARLAAMDALAAGITVALCGPASETRLARRIAAARGLAIVHEGERVPLRASGGARPGHVTFAGGTSVAADLLVVCWRQPSYELALQAGMSVVLAGDPPVMVAQGEALMPIRLTGGAALVPAEGDGAAWTPDPRAIACHCEDVRIRELDRAIADGFDEIETLKRRTGAATGPCQGKLCHAEIAACLKHNGRPAAVPTQRPLARPVTLADLARRPT